MANNAGVTGIAQPIDTLSDQDTFPITYANKIQGGYKTVDLLVDRDTIPVERLTIGTLIKVEETGLIYHWNGATFDSNIKDYIGLSNVENYSALNMPISNATQNALDGKLDISQALTTSIPKGVYNVATNVATNISGSTTNLTQTPDSSFTNGSYYTVTVSGSIGFDGLNFNSGSSFNVGDLIVKYDTQWGVTPAVFNTLSTLRGNISLETDLQRFERTPFFVTGVRDDIQEFLVDIQFSGLSLSESDVIHIFQISRNVTGNWFFSIGINAVDTSGRICQFTTSTNPEPTADSKGNRIQTISLSALNSSGVTATAVVNWSAITSGVDNYFSNSTAWRQSTFNKGVVLRRLLDQTNINVTDNTNRILTLENTDLFKGKNLNNSVNNFLLDIQFFGLSIGSSDVVHVYNIARNAISGSDRKWTFSIGINSTDNSGRICQYNALNITEPTADSKGNRIQTISLSALNSSGVTATAVVNWSAITDESDSYWSSSNTWTQVSFNNKAISKRILGDNITAIITTNINVTDNTNRLVTLEKSTLFVGKNLNNSVNNFLLDIQFFGLSVGSSDVIHVYNIARNAVSGADRKWTFSIGINATDNTGRICQYNALNITEPTADAKGNRIQTISLTALNSSGVTATATVNWSAITDATDNYWSSSTAWQQSTFNPKAISKSILGKNITDLATTNANVTANANEIASIGNNNLVLNNAVNSKVKAFLLDIAFEGNFVKPTTGQFVHINNLWRAYNGNQWVVDIAISGTRFVSFNSTTYAEPTADANGRIVDIISLSAFSGSGITAKMKVDWSALSLGERLFFTSSGSYAQGALSPNAYNQTIVVGSTNTKTDLPFITIPNRIYTVLEDVSDRNLISANARTLQDEARNYSLSLYVDKFLKAFPLNTDVRFDATGTDKFRLSSPRLNDNDVATDHATPSQNSTKSVVISGGTNYNNKTVSVPHYSTRESTNPDFLTKALFFGDSTIEGLQKEIGVPVGFGCISWSVVHEQFKKCQIDYWLKNGVSISDIQNDTVSSTYKDKYRYIGVGTRTGIYTDNYSINYRGVTKSFAVSAEGRGGWNINSYLNKPTLMVRSQGTWDILGLGNGTGTDYTGSASQIELYDRTAFNSNNILDTSAMRAWFLTNLSYTGSTLSDYKTRGQQLADNPVNPFYDDAKNSTVTDSLGQSWQVKYSITKYLSRYRTMDNSGIRLANVDSSKGTLVSNTTDYDVTLPNFIVMQSCQNDGNVAHFGRLTKAMADAIRAEYSANSYGTVNVGISIIDGAGTYFPKLYPYVSDFCSIDEFQRQCHNDNLGRAITELSGIEDTNRTFVLSHTHIIPTAKSIIWRNGNSPEFDLTGDLQDSYNIASRTSIGIKAHINAIGNRPIGIHTYAWIKYVLGL